MRDMVLQNAALEVPFLDFCVLFSLCFQISRKNNVVLVCWVSMGGLVIEDVTEEL